jgi:hypothetical protein
VRYATSGFSCSEQRLFVIERSFDALASGTSIGKGDDEIRGVADIFFKDGMENLRTALMATCKLWTPDAQLANNANFHQILNAGHSIVLNEFANHKDFMSALLLLVGLDYFYEYVGDSKEKLTTNAYNQVIFSKCSEDSECWGNQERLVALMSFVLCGRERELPRDYQTEYCKQTEFSIE